MFFNFALPQWLLRMLARILYIWTRPTVYPESIDKLGLKPGVGVCYVLQSKYLANMLVLARECQRLGLPDAMQSIRLGRFHARHSVVFLPPSSTSTAAKPASEQDRPNSLRQLAQAALDNGQSELQVVAVTILWGRAPDKQHSFLKAFFSEAWQAMGPFSRLLAIILNGRDTLVRFSEPASLRELLRNEQEAGRAAHKMERVLRLHFRRQREIAVGPNLSHRQTQLRGLLARPEIRNAIAQQAIRDGKPFIYVEKMADRYAKEIASDYSYSVAHALFIALDWLWTRLYDDLIVSNFERVTSLARTHTIVYIPCHRSYLDYFALAYLLYARGVSMPQVAAGANLNLPLVGAVLRGSGAFFLRRKIRGNELYSMIFKEYLNMMISQGYSIEYFIEGGRSRSGRMLPPRTGMLSMTIEGFERNRTRPLAFVPAYIGYEKLLEGSNYLNERSKPKQSETLLFILATLAELRKYFGKVYVNFGEPLILNSFLNQHHADWLAAEVNPRSPEFRHAVDAAAIKLTRRINSAAVVTSSNLVAVALLSTPKHTADIKQLQTQINHLQYILDNIPYRAETVLCSDNPSDIIDHAIRLNLVRHMPHSLGDMIVASPEQSSLLAYFRNNVLHLFALPALLACLISHNRVLPRQRVKEAITGIFGLLRAELFIEIESDDLDGRIDCIEEAFARRGLILVDDENDALRSPSPIHKDSTALQQIGDVIRPTLERQFLTLALLHQYGSGKLTQAKLEESGNQLAQRLSLLYEFNSPEFSERAQFANVIRNLISNDFLHADDAGFLHFDQRIAKPALHTELLLSAAVRETIQRFASDAHDSEAAVV